ncbi:uncharacterized protein LOC142163499 [Nicotiana tabacum]|uniref:Uncharacterized protein LOC142163499 n=1 Tax=Nicotiana tabacum TaxID=4097 RepID=A0AC58RVZ2_TOBAC
MDGYPAEFFKEYWPIIGKEVIEAVQQFFQTGKLLKEINCTTVTLIPKSAFIEGRNILDNVIMAHELIKGYSQKAVSPICMIKVDIRKAYDSVEWSFFESSTT